MNERHRIDPDNRYSADGLLTVEKQAIKVLEHLPGATVTRTRDAIQLDYLRQDGLTLLLTAEAMELRLPTVEWTMGSYGPAPSSRLWRRVEWNEVPDLVELIQAAITARQAEFANCRYCGRSYPVEHLFSKDVCHSCASNEMGVVY